MNCVKQFRADLISYNTIITEIVLCHYPIKRKKLTQTAVDFWPQLVVESVGLTAKELETLSKESETFTRLIIAILKVVERDPQLKKIRALRRIWRENVYEN